MTAFAPINALESALEAARAGRIGMPDFLRQYAHSDIFVPSGSEVMHDGSGFQPVLFSKNGVQMVACFTAVERIGDLCSKAPYCLTIRGIEFLRRIPREYGLVVNPGQLVGFDVTPDGLKRIVAELA